MNEPTTGESPAIPDLDQLAIELSEALPDCRIGVVRPWLAKPYVQVSRGLFAAVLIRPQDDELVLHPGIPNNGLAALLGVMAMNFGRRQRKILADQVIRWAKELRGLRVKSV